MTPGGPLIGLTGMAPYQSMLHDDFGGLRLARAAPTLPLFSFVGMLIEQPIKHISITNTITFFIGYSARCEHTGHCLFMSRATPDRIPVTSVRHFIRRSGRVVVLVTSTATESQEAARL